MKRKIIERLLACLIIGTAVFTFSCKGVSNSVNDEIKDKTDEQNKAVLRLSASTKNARTALPSINVEDFTEFALYGVKISGDSAALQYDELGKWNDSSKMQNASIESSLGKWNFKLSAKKRWGRV
ncbi:MAG: hypothetical protein K6A43_12295 [Treponema sp.]|nr:hypothetical protein [Treponema sp.]